MVDRFFSDIYVAKLNTMKFRLTILLVVFLTTILITNVMASTPFSPVRIEAKVNTGLSLLLLFGLMLGAWKLHTAGRHKN